MFDITYSVRSEKLESLFTFLVFICVYYLILLLFDLRMEFHHEVKVRVVNNLVQGISDLESVRSL